MKIPATLVLCLLSFPAMSGVPEPEITILSPPDAFFTNEETLEVVVSYNAPRGRAGLFLRLLVNGLEVDNVRTPATDGGRMHIFRVPISGPVALVQVGFSRGKRGPSASVASVRGAGLAEFRKLRATMEEMEEISAAILQYRVILNYPVPEDLDTLVPAFLAEVSARSPLGPPYEYETDGLHFRIRVPVPGQGEVVLEDGTFTAFPRDAITDREAARLVREELTRMATALDAYRIDNNVYPERFEDVVPIFLLSIPPVDPYGNPYFAEVTPAGYRLASMGQDGKVGGAGFNADTIMETGIFLSDSTRYRGQREYMGKALKNLSWLYWGIRHVADQTDDLPLSLEELEPFVGRGALFDLCGNPYRYVVRDHGDEQSFLLSADGCDGVPQTDATERSVSGVHPSPCSSRQFLLVPPQSSGLFD